MIFATLKQALGWYRATTAGKPWRVMDYGPQVSASPRDLEAAKRFIAKWGPCAAGSRERWEYWLEWATISDDAGETARDLMRVDNSRQRELSELLRDAGLLKRPDKSLRAQFLRVRHHSWQDLIEGQTQTTARLDECCDEPGPSLSPKTGSASS